MRAVRYNTRLDIDRLPMLVKESSFNYNGQFSASKVEDVYHFLNEADNAKDNDVEKTYLLCLNAHNKLIGWYIVSQGTAIASLMTPREVFIKALAVGATQIIIAHNHPSGDATPSKEDNEITKIMVDAGALLRIPVLDHIIIGDHQYYSYYESNNIIRR